MRQEQEHSSIRHAAERIITALRARDLDHAKADIAEAMAADMDAPEPHNLLGIFYELNGDFQAARRHYRAAYALDPTYKPCCRNLERITSYDFSSKITDMDFGDGRILEIPDNINENYQQS